MIESILKEKYSIHWLVFHVVLGFLTVLSKWPMIIWFYIFLFSSVYKALLYKNANIALYILAYIPGIELLGRMTSSYPYIPWEIGKYFPVLILLLLLFIEKRSFTKMLYGITIILLTIPSWILGNPHFERISFTLFGIINVGIITMIFYQRRVHIHDFIRIVKTMLFPLITILVLVIVKSPSVTDMSFGLGSNAKATGGFGSNQVSTVLGIGFVLSGMAYILGYKLFKYKMVILSIIFLFLLRGLLSFSRGGMMVAVLGFAATVFFLNGYKPLKGQLVAIKKIKITHFIIGLVFLAGVFYVANEITHGSLALRYMGETNSSIHDGKEKSLNSITTGRYDIFMADIDMWLNEPFWGVGGGNSDIIRLNYGIHNVSHSEFSRLLAEQGIFGLIIIFMLVIPVLTFARFNRLQYAVFIGFWILSIGDSFHAAMRTMITPFFFGLSLISLVADRRIKPNKPTESDNNIQT